MSNDPLHNTKSPPQKNAQGRNNILWAILSVAIAGVSIWAVMSQAKEASLRSILGSLRHADPLWLGAALLSMLGFIFFEAAAIRTTCKALHCRPSMGRCWVYSASDIYFSAITPSATGGQPACAYLMIHDGVPGAATTVALLMNLTMYTLSILAIGLFTFLAKPRIFLRFRTLSTVLILVGCVVQLVMALVFFLLVKNERLLQKISQAVLHLLDKLHLVRREQALREKLDRLLEEYKVSSTYIAGQRGLLIRVFLLNFMQRLSQITVTMFVYLATGGGPVSAFDIWATQSYVVLGSNYVPIPGGMAVTDYIMLDGFGSFLPAQRAVDLEIISRSLSFYICILLCGTTILVGLWLSKRRKRERKAI